MGVRENPDLELYGFWQTKPFEPPVAKNGKVPRNDYGNVELFQQSMLPIGCVHLRLPNLNKLCRTLGIDCAPAVVGFDAHHGFSHAVYDGWVVCEEFKDIVIDAFKEDERQNEIKMIEKKKERIWSNWKNLIRSILVRERLKIKYGDQKKIKTATNSKTKKDLLENDEDDGTKIENEEPVFKVKQSPDFQDELQEYKPITKKNPRKKKVTKKKVDDGDSETAEPSCIGRRYGLRRKATKTEDEKANKRKNTDAYFAIEEDDEDFDYESDFKGKASKMNLEAKNANEKSFNLSEDENCI